MKAAVAYGPRDVRIEEVDIPQISDSEVLIRVKAIGVCPSDVRSYEGVYFRKLYDWGKDSFGLSGHEWSGEIVSVGDEVKGFQVGDRVVGEPIIPCGICKFCRKGATNLCIDKKLVIRGFAEYLKSPSKSLFKIPEGVSYEAAAFSEPVAACLHANEALSPRPGETVLIIGGGPMGLIHLQLSKLSGATVVLSEVIEDRLMMARELGADVAVNPTRSDMVKEVKELTDGYGADGVIVATGARKAIEDAFNAVSGGGKVVLFGGSYPPVMVEIDPNLIHYKEIKIMGSYDQTPIHIERALNLIAKGRIDVERLIAQRLPLSRLKEAFELVKGMKTLKIFIKFD
ncbi:MAG: alcohol dehydrogenase catalytic domain-containing protein [Candidatus Bathyarchaeia archaeon]